MSTDYGLSAFAVDGETYSLRSQVQKAAAKSKTEATKTASDALRGSFMARSAVVPIRVSPEERVQLYESAKRFSVSLSEFVRRAALKLRMPAPPVTEVNRETYRELCRIGNNVNQLMRAINEGRVGQVDPKILAELRALVKEVGLQCLGLGCVVGNEPR